MAESNGQPFTLYVGDLGSEVHEEDLKKFFGNEFAKDIVSVSMMTDNEARHPTKWAYVSFKTLESSVKALKEKNLQDLHGKPCRLMQYNNDPTFRRTGKGNLFVKNIAPTVTTKELSEFFSQFGEPVSCKVELSNGKSKGYGYVQFSAVEEAEKAITEGNGKELRGQALDIQHFQTQQERSGEMEGTSVYVKGLPVNKNFTEEQLKGFFAECGEIKSIQLFRDHSGVLKGSAVVHFGDRDQRAAALNLNEKEFLETKIKVLVYKTKSQLSDERRIRGQEIERMNNERKQRNLFVKNLHPDTTEESLREVFAKFGEIESVFVKKNEKNPQSDTKMGFVCFKNEDNADAARKKMFQREVNGNVIFVEFVKNHTERTRERESRMPANFATPYYPMNTGRPVHFMRGGFAPMAYRPRYGNQFPFYPNQATAIQFIPHDMLRHQMNSRYGGNGRGGYRGGAGHRGSGYPRNMNRNYEVTQRVRNARSTHEQEAAATAAAKTATATQEKQVTSDTTGLAEMSEEEFKNHMGNQIYEEAQQMYESRAGKITGMILDAHDRSSLVEIVQDSNNLQKAIEEAYNYLKEHANQDEEEDDQQM